MDGGKKIQLPPGIGNQIRLVWKLFKDPRVPLILKSLPVGALVYHLIPTDLMPGVVLDDAVVWWIGLKLFVELAPPDVVRELSEGV